MGHLKKRKDGIYQASVYIGKDGDKKSYKYFYGKTERETKTKAEEYKKSLSRGMTPDQAGTTVQQLCEQLVKAQQIKGSTAGWMGNINAHIKKLQPLHNVQVKDIRTADLQECLAYYAGPHDGRKALAKKTLSEVVAVWSRIFDQAIPEIITYNPCAKLVRPAARPPEAREALTREQVEMVLNTPHRAKRAAMLMLYSGLRRGEAGALTWDDADLSAGTITVKEAADYHGGGIKSPKTAAGVRVVHIPSALVEYLSAEKAAENPLNPMVLHSASGKPMTHTAWVRLWDSYMADLNVKYGYAGKASKCTPGGLPIKIDRFTPHQLRHTFCTMLYYAGVDVMTAKNQMGHADVKTTMSIYTHLDKEQAAKSMSKFDEYVRNT